MNPKTLKKIAIISFLVSMVVLLIAGFLAMDKVPPYPEKVVDLNGNLITTRGKILKGQNIYQKYGLMDFGSVWGHGTVKGPDFSALTLKIIYDKIKEYYSNEFSGNLDAYKTVIDEKVKNDIKTNRYDPKSKTLILTDAQVYALNYLRQYYNNLFKEGDVHKGSLGYGFLKETIKKEEERLSIADFFFWTAWASSVNRPNLPITYTNNWPYFKEIDNTLSVDAIIWSIAGILALLGGLGLVLYLIHRYQLYYDDTNEDNVSKVLINMPITNSQRKSAKFFIIVNVLFLIQILMGGLLAHYTTNPGHFYIPKIAELIPYNWAKSWHLQLAIFWIATAWIGSSIYLSPIINGKEKKGQGILVDILFYALISVVLGSLVGIVFSIKGKFENDNWFWFGHQGWEYLELGRFWQIFLFVGLLAWLFIVYRGIKDKISGPKKDKSGLVEFYILSIIMLAMFFAFAFFYGRRTHLTVADYWRWFVVHIWVEGIFEFFAIAIISLFLSIMGLVNKESAIKVSYFSAILVFASGIIGTAHHYFWYGGPSYWIALGTVFSSLEPIPLILLVVKAWDEYKGIKEQGMDFPYKWPFYFLIASSFWNFVGAGIFGFIINLPMINYFEHGTYLTTNHAHAALFGVYGMLSISLLLFAWRGLINSHYWNNKLIKYVFWCLNGGLALMVLMTLLPVGIYQTVVALKYGYWFARSPEFYNIPIVKTLLLLRIIPDTIVIVGAILLLYFLLSTYPKIKKAKIKDKEPIKIDKEMFSEAL